MTYSRFMLDKNDKQWITQLVQENTKEICKAMAEGFSECVSVSRFEHWMEKTEARFWSLEQRVTHIEDTMVTRDYLDKRLFDFKERRVDEPIKQLKMIDLNILEELKTQKIINPKRANSIASMHPFPQKLTSS